MSKKQRIQTYEISDKTLNPLFTLSTAIHEIYGARHIVWHLFKRDFLAQFRQKILGYLWIIIGPLAGVIPFIFLNKVGIFNPGKLAMPYPVFIVLGMGIWGFLSHTFVVVSSGMQNNEDLIMRTNIPKITFVIKGLADIFYALLVHWCVAIAFVFALGLTPSIWSIFYPVLILPVIFFGVGLGLMFCVVGAIARDLSGLMSTFLNLLMFLSPVVFMPQFNHPILKFIVTWNPFSYLVDVPRSALFLGEFPNIEQYLYATALASIVLVVGVHSFYLIKDKVAERL